MRILYCTDMVLDARLVPTIHIDAICSNFAEMGHEVVLFAPRNEGFLGGMYEKRIIASPRFLLTLWYQPRLFVPLFVEMLRKRPDLLYVRHSHLLIVPTIVGGLFRVPIFLEINGILEQDAKHLTQTLRSRFFLASGAFALLEKINARLATKCIAVTGGIKEYFIARYGMPPEKIAVIPNGVDIDRFKPSPSGHTGIRVGYIGSLHEWQGIRFIVEAARLLPSIQFRIVGDGEMRDYIEKNRLANVKLLPAIPHERVPQAINDVDICISYPLKFREGATSPFKVYEYLACGKPVISADLPSMRKEFGDVLTYARAEDPEALAKAIREMIDSPQRRSAAGSIGRAFVEQDRSWQSVAQKILNVYNGLV